ncbi:MAG: hypothetical protein JWN44_2934 [Myxococcales bacterium]|nr:hypothetical protein [Myxococcales bacterium]
MKKDEKKLEKKQAKLKLHKETLRVLSSAELSHVHGGMMMDSHNQAQSCGGGDGNDPQTDPMCR